MISQNQRDSLGDALACLLFVAALPVRAEDLGIYGDDWDEVLLGLNQFNPVDWSGFEFGRYFPSEPTVLTPIARLFFSSRSDDGCALTVGHLALVLERGKWFEPPTSP